MTSVRSHGRARDLIAIGVTGIVAATIAAFVPARSAARVPVLSALAGRRPLGALPRWIVPIGVALFGERCVRARSRGHRVAEQRRRCARAGRGVRRSARAQRRVLREPGCRRVARAISAADCDAAGRVAVRSIVRNRARSAAVVMALAAINAGAVAIATAFDSGTHKIGSEAPLMPDNALIVTRHPAPQVPDLSQLPPEEVQGTKAQLAAVPPGFLPVPASVERGLARDSARGDVVDPSRSPRRRAQAAIRVAIASRDPVAATSCSSLTLRWCSSSACQKPTPRRCAAPVCSRCRSGSRPQRLCR